MRIKISQDAMAVIFMAVIFAALAAVAFAQEKPSAAPTLTATETIALRAVSAENEELQKQFAQLNQAINAIEKDVAKSHPGFHLDLANPLSGKLVADTKK